MTYDPYLIQSILNQSFPQRRFMTPGLFPQMNPVSPVVPRNVPRGTQLLSAQPVPPVVAPAAPVVTPPQQPTVVSPAPQPTPSGLLGGGGFDDPMTQGLIALGSSLLESSGPSLTPISLGQAIGRAGTAGIGAIQQAKQSHAANLLAQAKLANELKPRQHVVGENLVSDTGQVTYAGQPKTPEGFIRAPDGSLMVDPNWLEAQKQLRSGGSPYSTLAYGPNGEFLAFNNRTERLRPLSVEGRAGGQVVGAKFNPALQATLSGAKTSGQESSKAYNDLIEGSSKVEEQLSLATDTLRQFDQYSKNSALGTGPFATGFGLKQYTDADTQQLEAAFRTINLKNMAATFDGMSRAIDTQAERQAWERTQPGIKLDDPVNYQILVGNISMATKAKAEADARKQYIDSSPDGTLKGYQSPIFGKTKTMFNANGDAIVVPNNQVPSAKKNGLMTADEFTATLSSGKTAGKPQNNTPRKNITVDY